MNRSFDLPLRQVHLDFHTGPDIPNVGSLFDPERFAQTMVDAHVNSVTVFAKCHHGHLYYDTAHPARHPGLSKQTNLLRMQVDALHQRGIRAPIYLSVQCDEYAANQHPEWVARNDDSTTVGGRSLMKPYPNFHWQILDMSSPYQDYLAAQLAEVLEVFNPVDGIFFDMCWDQPSTNAHFLMAMRAAGMDPESSNHRTAYARQLSLQYMRRLHDQVKAANPYAGVYFNSRPMDRLAEDAPFQAQIEIEALPTGGWGYLFFPKNVRYARTFGKPYLGMTARFHKSWADFGGLKPYAALEYETSQMIAHGAGCSIGDQLHPRGTLDSAAYDLIGSVYKRVAEREPYLRDAEPVVDIGVFQARADDDSLTTISGTDEGVTRMLVQLKHQFNIIGRDSELAQYKLVILPDQVVIDTELSVRLEEYVGQGGAILASGLSGLPTAKSVAIKALGIEAIGPSLFATTYFRARSLVQADLPAMDHVVYEPGHRVRPQVGTEIVADTVEPYFDRQWNHFSSHAQTPPADVSEFPTVTLNGNAAYIAFPIFKAFAQHGSPAYRTLVRNLINTLLPSPVIRVVAPTSTEASVMRQANRTIVHLLHYSPERRTPQLDLVEDIIPLYDIEISLRLDREPSRIYIAPTRVDLAFEFDQGRALFTLPEMHGHAMIVLE